MDNTMVTPTDSRAGALLAGTLTPLIVAWAVYLCRIYTRIYIVRGVFLEDYFITLGMASLTTLAAMACVSTAYGGGAHLANVADPMYNIPRWGHTFFIAQQMYVVTLFGVKMSVFCLLLRFSVSRGLNWTLYVVAAVTTSLTIAFTLWLTFQCSPVSAQWDITIKGDCIDRDAYVTSVYVLSAISATTDIITAIAPIFVLKTLTLDTKTKWCAGITMGLGSVACVATLIRFKFVRDFAISEDLTYAMVPLSIASFIEVALGCICASLATLRPFIQRFIIRSGRERSFQAGTGPDGSHFDNSSSTYNSALKSYKSQDIVELGENPSKINSRA